MLVVLLSVNELYIVSSKFTILFTLCASAVVFNVNPVTTDCSLFLSTLFVPKSEISLALSATSDLRSEISFFIVAISPDSKALSSEVSDVIFASLSRTLSFNAVHPTTDPVPSDSANT